MQGLLVRSTTMQVGDCCTKCCVYRTARAYVRSTEDPRKRIVLGEQSNMVIRTLPAVGCLQLCRIIAPPGESSRSRFGAIAVIILT